MTKLGYGRVGPKIMFLKELMLIKELNQKSVIFVPTVIFKIKV